MYQFFWFWNITNFDYWNCYNLFNYSHCCCQTQKRGMFFFYYIYETRLVTKSMLLLCSKWDGSKLFALLCLYSLLLSISGSLTAQCPSCLFSIIRYVYTWVVDGPGCSSLKIGPYVETLREAQLEINLLKVRSVDAKGLPLLEDKQPLTSPAQVRLGLMLADALKLPHNFLKCYVSVWNFFSSWLWNANGLQMSCSCSCVKASCWFLTLYLF